MLHSEVTWLSLGALPTSMSGLGRRMLEKGILPRPSRLTKVAAPRSPRSEGASSLMRSGANQRVLHPLKCLLMNACEFWQDRPCCQDSRAAPTVDACSSSSVYPA